MASASVLNAVLIHEFPHVLEPDVHQELPPLTKHESDCFTDPSAKIADYARTVKFPSKAEFREILADREQTNELYQSILDTRKTLNELTEEYENTRSQTIGHLPENWTVRISPYFERAHQMALHRFHSPQSSYFLPNSDDDIVAIIRQWNIFPESIWNYSHGSELILAWIKTTYELERAAVRNKVLGIRMSVRKNRKLDGKSLSQELLLSANHPVTLQAIKKTVLLRDLAKRSGAWEGIKTFDNNQKEQKFWGDYVQELRTLRDMSLHQAEAHLTKMIKDDQNSHGKF
ncbi:hypothetical protein K7432_006543 [Basidiobolus ranarum]|uniref:Uncharacterized protein n=1 Tax=Basidiobolus ranarum TaxID=34480 RepID=A0ABR2WUR7_9FUNG